MISNQPQNITLQQIIETLFSSPEDDDNNDDNYEQWVCLTQHFALFSNCLPKLKFRKRFFA